MTKNSWWTPVIADRDADGQIAFLDTIMDTKYTDENFTEILLIFDEHFYIIEKYAKDDMAPVEDGLLLTDKYGRMVLKDVMEWIMSQRDGKFLGVKEISARLFYKCAENCSNAHVYQQALALYLSFPNSDIYFIEWTPL